MTRPAVALSVTDDEGRIYAIMICARHLQKRQTRCYWTRWKRIWQIVKRELFLQTTDHESYPYTRVIQLELSILTITIITGFSIRKSSCKTSSMKPVNTIIKYFFFVCKWSKVSIMVVQIIIYYYSSTLF